jgi:hypothetical protein
MKPCTLIKLFFGILVLALCFASFASDITRKRVAVFSEEGFPSRSPRSAEWYKKTLEEAGLKVNIINIKDFCDVKKFNRDKYDTLIVATGGLLPSDAEYALGMFMRGGGTVVMDGSFVLGFGTAPKEVIDEASRLKRDFIKGKNIQKYQEFMCKQGIMPGVTFRYDKEVKRWVPASYITLNSEPWRPVPLCGEFEFEAWPNPYQKNSEYYGRPLNENLKINPELAKEQLPQVLPLSIETDSGDIITAEPNKNKMLRWSIFGGKLGDGRPSYDFSNDVLIPVYLFDKPSGRKYPAFSIFGKKQKDRESDFFIYRSHRALKNGYTLLHFGLAGAHLLKSKEGKKTLIAALKLAESRLPGERSKAYASACHQMDAAMTQCSKVVITGIADLQRLAKILYSKGDESGVENILRQIMEMQDRFREFNTEWRGLRALNMQPGESGISERNALAKRCQKYTSELESSLAKSRASLKQMTKSNPSPKVENPIKKIFFNFDFVSPNGLTRQLELAHIAKSLGFSGIPIYGNQYSGQVFKETGLTSGFRMDGSEHERHFTQEKFETARFAPHTSSIKPAGNSSWWDTKESRERWEQQMGWILSKLNNDHPEICRVFCMAESNLKWSMWDERMRQKLIIYLKKKYGNIKVLNQIWGTSFAGFEEIKLPNKRPENQKEHAIWEDWTRYREVYFIEEVRKPVFDMIKKYGPRLTIMSYQSYCGQEAFPSPGINYYEYGKSLSVNALEMGSLGPLRDEVMTADIAGFFNKSITPEWGATYACCMAGGDWLKFNIWNGIGWGQIGWCTFAGSSANLDYSNFVDTDNRVTQLGWMLKALMKDLDVVKPIFLDGKREEPSIRILYSPTTNRHTNWPGGDSDKSFKTVSGYYRALQMLHLQARAIDEGAILDNLRPKECRIIIVPETVYLNQKLGKKLREFLENGGTILATSDAGSFDEYGHQENSMLTLAGVATKPISKAEIDLGNGRSYVAKTVGSSSPKALEVLFPEAKAIMKYTNGDIAVTRTQVGKGTLLISGIPFGQQFLTEQTKVTKGNKRSPLDLIERLMSLCGAEREYACNDMEMAVRPWLYKGKKYIAVVTPSKTGLIYTGAKGFSFKRTPSLIPFELKVKGNWKASDVALGTNALCSYDQGFTTIHSLIPNPGGLVLGLEPGKMESKGKTIKTSLKLKKTTDAASVAPKTNGEKLSFNGRIGSEDGIMRLGSYSVNVAVESKKQGWWQDSVYLTVEKGGEKKRKKCEEGKTLIFNFFDKTVKFVCEKVSPEMPIGVTGRMWEEKRNGNNRDLKCRLIKEDFQGQPSIVMENGYIRARILPKLGGRLIELAGCDEDINQLYDSKAEIRNIADAGWIDIGGVEENLGQWPGQLWNKPFKIKIISNTSKKLAVALQYQSHKNSSKYTFEKTFILNAGEMKLEVINSLVNNDSNQLRAKIWIHPELTPGGDASLSDILYLAKPEGELLVPFESGKCKSVPNGGAWNAAVDSEKQSGLIQIYPQKQVQNLYYQFNSEAINLEFGTAWKNLRNGEKMELCYSLGILQGVPDVCGANETLALSISIDGENICRPNELRNLILRGSALSQGVWQINVELEQDGKTVAQITKAKWDIDPAQPKRLIFPWKIGNLSDGKYSLVVKAVNSSEKKQEFVARRTFKVVGAQIENMMRKVAEYRQKLATLKSKALSSAENYKLRQLIIRSAILINKMAATAKSGDTDQFSKLEQELNTAIKSMGGEL